MKLQENSILFEISNEVDSMNSIEEKIMAINTHQNLHIVLNLLYWIDLYILVIAIIILVLAPNTRRFIYS